MRHRGIVELLVRRRVPVGFVCGALVLWMAAPTLAKVVAGAGIAFLGEAFRFWASGHVNKAREVTASGPYRWFAHPLYMGSSIMGGGLAVACGSLAAAVLIAAYLMLVILPAMRAEEAFLLQRFGHRYDRYLRDGIVDAGGRFSFGLAMRNREYRAVVGLAIAMLLLLWKATYNEPISRTAGARIARPGG